ncbi:uncharacterized protein N7511_009941 [Penicillium nucicola]|uniref:uncharacterized protein n=1 Tax=Penicillium nucicola TaxID=1850975 RepID=UPI002544EC02|nr:uncharacterized protein N7511_009941 [Penicillium nucicola]KAJ5748245.1 hypothetical protein N7511_009941 [Penicillium nucicola]
MGQQVVIRFQDVELWEINREQVDSILVKYTGTSEYPSTRNLPPFIFGIDLSAEAIQELEQLQGVVVQVQSDDE